MANSGNRILYILKYLYEQTDPEHYLTAQQIIELLEAEGIHTYRKTVIADIDDLIDFGIDIICVKSRQNRYHIRSRMFTLPELTLLIAGRERKNTVDTVEVKIKELYPHLYDKNTKINISSQLYSEQLEHILHRDHVLIRISDFYKGNRGEQKFMEVTDAFCQTLVLCRKIDKNEEERQKDNTDCLGFDEITRGEVDGIYTESSEKEIYIYLSVVQLFSSYGEKILNRAIMYFINCYSIDQIAMAENISNEAARKAVRRIEEIVQDVGVEYFGI